MRIITTFEDYLALSCKSSFAHYEKRRLLLIAERPFRLPINMTKLKLEMVINGQMSLEIGYVQLDFNQVMTALDIVK